MAIILKLTKEDIITKRRTLIIRNPLISFLLKHQRSH